MIQRPQDLRLHIKYVLSQVHQLEVIALAWLHFI